MKKSSIALLGSLLFGVSAMATEIPIQNSVVIENPTHLGVSFLAFTGYEDFTLSDLELMKKMTIRASSVCRLMGYSTPSGSTFSYVGREKLMYVDSDQNVTSRTYMTYDIAFRQSGAAGKFTRISCKR